MYVFVVKGSSQGKNGTKILHGVERLLAKARVVLANRLRINNRVLRARSCQTVGAAKIVERIFTFLKPLADAFSNVVGAQFVEQVGGVLNILIFRHSGGDCRFLGVRDWYGAENDCGETKNFQARLTCHESTKTCGANGHGRLRLTIGSNLNSGPKGIVAGILLPKSDGSQENRKPGMKGRIWRRRWDSNPPAV